MTAPRMCYVSGSGAHMAGTWPINVLPTGQITAGAVLWRQAGQLNATVVVESQLRLVPDRAMMELPSEAVLPEQLAPRLEQAEVYISRAEAHAQQSSAAIAVRLVIYRGEALIDKNLLVYPYDVSSGRARAVESVPLEPPQPALGVVVDPARPDQAASFGPMSGQQRADLLGGLPTPSMQGNVMELPDDLPFTFFRAAQPDQVVKALHGDEWVVLDGMHPTLPRLQSQLPRKVAVARVYSPGLAESAMFELPLRADRLVIDAVAARCALFWRGDFTVADEARADEYVAVAAMVRPGQAPRWPTIEEIRQRTEQMEAMSAWFDAAADAAAPSVSGMDSMPPSVARAMQRAQTQGPQIPDQSADQLEMALSDQMPRGNASMEDYVSSLFYRLEGPDEPPKKE